MDTGDSGGLAQHDGETPEAGGHDDGGPDAGHETGSAEAATDTSAPLGLVTVPLSGCVPFYTANVTIGGAEAFALIVDTGSTTLAVASSSCTTCTGVSPLYTPGSTAVDEHETASSTYGGGAMWSGEVYDDSVGMGTPTASAPVMLAAIDSQSQFFLGSITCGSASTPYSSQGVIGFAPGPDAVMGTDGFFDQFRAGDPSIRNVFATELCDSGGTLWLGGYDPSPLTATPQYVPLSNSAIGAIAYAVDLEQISVGTPVPTIVDVPTGSYTESIVDTGTSVFLLQPTAFSAVTAAITGSAGFQTIFGDAASSFFNSSDCVSLLQTKAQIDTALPTLTLVFGTNPAISVLATATESYLIPDMPGVWCSAIQSSTPSAAVPVASIIGSPLLRSSVVIFDRSGMQLGFAPHTSCP
jgi:hypothetical protein